MRWKVPVALLPLIVLAATPAPAGDLAQVRSLVEEGRPADALSDLEEHLEEHPIDPEAMFLRGLVLAEVERQVEAREVFEEVSGLRPDRPEPLNNLAVLKAAQGDYDGAVETLKEALRTHPAYRTAYENLTKIYGQLASEAYSRALSVDGAHDRSSLELVLLSDMVLPATSVAASVSPAAAREEAPGRPAVEERADADEMLAVSDESARAEPVFEEQASAATPDEAIAAVLDQGREQTETMVDPEAAVEVEEAAPDDATTVSGSVGAPDDDGGPETAELAALVEAWAGAWSEQRVDDYLSFYSAEFEPADGASLDEWRALRRARVSAPEFIKVSVAFLSFDVVAPDRVSVVFNQSYESDAFTDVVTKTLELTLEDGTWKIIGETVDS